MNIVAQYGIRAGGARGIVTSVEAAIREGRPAAGAALPTARDLARALRAVARRQFDADVLPAGPLAVVGGALDGIGRVLQAQLRPGDRVALEDPGYVAVFDLVAALGLVAEPVAVDDAGPRPDALGRALGAGVEAFILTPRAQNPTGAALDAGRARELRAVLRRHPATLVV